LDPGCDYLDEHSHWQFQDAKTEAIFSFIRTKIEVEYLGFLERHQKMKAFYKRLNKPSAAIEEEFEALMSQAKVLVDESLFQLCSEHNFMRAAKPLRQFRELSGDVQRMEAKILQIR